MIYPNKLRSISYRSITLLIMLLCSSMLAIGSVFAAESDSNKQASKSSLTSKAASAEKAFAVPKVLAEANIENREDVIQLLNSIPLRTAFIKMATQLLDSKNNAELSNNDKINLTSILAKHQQTLKQIESSASPLSQFHYSIYADTSLELEQLATPANFESLVEKIAPRSLSGLSDESLYQASTALGWSLTRGGDYMLYLFQRYQNSQQWNQADALKLINNYQLYWVYKKVLETANLALAAEEQKRFIIEPDILIKTPDGVTLSAVVVRKRGLKSKRPAAFQFTIYADKAWHIKNAIHAAAHGYVGVIANSRGKGASPDEIVPWEHEGKDATAVIDWISKQGWNDGRVAMYGGSYNGFTQWAAAKHMHPALKAMAPYAAASLITGLPYENNIAITANYQWAFHVTNNKTMDHDVYADWSHWNDAKEELFKSGRAFRDIDKIEGTPNPWFQKWLDHPGYDEYYQKMTAYKDDYKNINIPVLSFTGYFDGGQISALDFLKRHYRNNPNANHSLLIGPYGHITAQYSPRSHYGNYKLDPVALQKDTQEITFKWFDHVLFNLPKPKLVQDKVNYQLMGSNQWRHTNYYAELNKRAVSFSLGEKQSDGNYRLSTDEGNPKSYVSLTVDLADRKVLRNLVPRPMIQQEIKDKNGLIFITEPFDSAKELAGAITGYFSIEINKKDVDIGYNFFAIDAKGETTFLNQYRSRASYAKDMEKRHLLKSGQKTSIPIINARMTAKLLEKGSRLAIVLNVNKNSDAQVNMGTGKDVSDETAADGKEPLVIKWFGDSKINIPIKDWE